MAAGSSAPRIIIAGAPASGKGTQCELIKEKLGVVHLSTGDMLRAAVKEGTPVGLSAKSYMDSGKLVPDEVIIGVVKERLQLGDCQEKGWLLDGFPRTAAQADALAKSGVSADCFLLLEVPDEMLIERVVGRRLDPETGAIYHMRFSPPPAEVASRVIQRSDDTEEKARVRLEQYHSNIDAVRSSYDAITKVIDGTRPKTEVFSVIKTHLQSLRGGGTQGAVVESIPTTPIPGMKPGTSGLRKTVRTWQEGYYLHNFVQSIFDVCKGDLEGGKALVLGGDGRYFNAEAIQTIIRIAAANGVSNIWVGQNGLLSTPALSAVVRERGGGGKCGLGIALTASHNPGGPDADFGIKFNNEKGSPAPEGVTEAVYQRTMNLDRIHMLRGSPDVDLSRPGRVMVGDTEVEVIDSVDDHIKLLRKVFDFDKLRSLLARPDFSMAYDGMAGAAGPYARAVLVGELGAPESWLYRCNPSEDFEGGHPDPNLTYAPDLVKLMGLSKDGSALPVSPSEEPPVFGAATDGDGDRNMVLGRRFFVTPSDSLAVICAHSDAIPYFAGGLRGVARSMPTSAAVDQVARALDIPLFETPTGWKFFGNLMDAEEMGHHRSYGPFLCGEESFGTGSDHVREKDGLWAVLAWLSVLAKHNSDPSKPLVGVEEIVRTHWERFGRNYYCRYDYETVDAAAAEAMMDALRTSPPPAGSTFNGFELTTVRDFEYEDPVDGSISKRQGLIMSFSDGSRVVLRLSGTGSVGATVRVYIEKFEPDISKHGQPTIEALRPLAEAGLQIARVQEFTGREAPTVIT